MADGWVQLRTDDFKTSNGVDELNRMLRFIFDNIAGDGLTRKIYSGTGTPLNNVTADIGSVYLRTDGGASTTLYIKESGSLASGWVPK